MSHCDDHHPPAGCAVGVGIARSKAFYEVAKGRVFHSPSITKRLHEGRKRSVNRDGFAKADGVRLTSRESEVLQLVAEGSANKQVAASLGISIKTVEKHRQRYFLF